MNTNSIERQIEIKAPIARVWRALTDHVEFEKWFGAKLEGPFVVGKTTSGQTTGSDCRQVRFETTVRRMEPERLFSYTWHPFAVDPGVDYSKETPTLVEFRLEESKGSTLLTVTESGFDRIPASRRAEAFRMHEQGWGMQLENVKAHVSPVEAR
jgi:uncharacterized protein YndB with AHSA1/START domain